MELKKIGKNFEITYNKERWALVTEKPTVAELEKGKKAIVARIKKMGKKLHPQNA